VQAVDMRDLEKRPGTTEATASIKARVEQARAIQTKRFLGRSVRLNKEMSVRDIDDLCSLNQECTALLHKAAQTMALSARAYHRTIKVARTIADLENSEHIQLPHIAEALQYRQKVEV
jgi:magnesium chelatase family protein